MFVYSPPSTPSQTVMVAQVNKARTGSQSEHVLGLCIAVPTFQTPPPPEESGEYVLSLPVDAQNYFTTYENKTVPDTGTVSVLSQPKHGTLEAAEGGVYVYLPNPGYLGKDGATFLVDVNGQKVKVIYFIRVIEGHAESDSGRFAALCKNGDMWQISALPTDLQSDARKLVLESEPTIHLNVAPLSNNTVGETAGEGTSSPSITLSPNLIGNENQPSTPRRSP